LVLFGGALARLIIGSCRPALRLVTRQELQQVHTARLIAATRY